MKLFSQWIENQNNYLYSGPLGYIKGRLRADGYYWVSEFVIKPELRGQGFAKELAQKIPEKAILRAEPFDNSIPPKKLIDFYKSLGFIEIDPENHIMQRF